MLSFDDFGIDVRGTTSGNVKTLCPKCSPEREKKNEPCLSVNIDMEAWNCHHCGWTGCLNIEGIEKVYPYTNEAGTDSARTTRKLVPDVLPDASNICTLLIKLGLTFKILY